MQGTVAVEQLDLADLASVRALAGKLVSSKTRLDIVILNAGVMACPPSTTKDGFEMQIGTNVHGHVALALGLLPHLKSQVCNWIAVLGLGLGFERVFLSMGACAVALKLLLYLYAHVGSLVYLGLGSHRGFGRRLTRALGLLPWHRYWAS